MRIFLVCIYGVILYISQYAFYTYTYHLHLHIHLQVTQLMFHKLIMKIGELRTPILLMFQ